MLNRPIHYTQAVTIFLPTGVGQKVFFDEQPRLESALILGIEAFSADQLVADEEGRPLIPAGDVVDIMCVFKVGSTEQVYQVPYSRLIAELQAGQVNQYAGLVINWPKSYIQIPPGVTVGTLPCVLFWNVHYIPVDSFSQFSTAELRSFKF